MKISVRFKHITGRHARLLVNKAMFKGPVARVFVGSGRLLARNHDSDITQRVVLFDTRQIQVLLILRNVRAVGLRSTSHVEGAVLRVLSV